jgi:cell wall-associated protease
MLTLRFEFSRFLINKIDWMKKFFGACFALLLLFNAYSQSTRTVKNGWHLLDKTSDGYLGISLQKAYELLKGRKSTTVVVAVIDSGIDTAQEDLREVLWKNPKEINGNGVDDDGNGYIDDIYGWNFCGSREGENLTRNSHEITRVYHTWRREFEGKNESLIPVARKFLYSQWIKAAAIIENDYNEAMTQYEGISNMLEALEASSKVINEHLAVAEFKAAQIKPLVGNANKRLSSAAELWIDFFSKAPVEDPKNTDFIKEVADYKAQLETKMNRKTKVPEDTRAALTKDNYTDINDKFYGNHNLKMGSGDHGTMVSGTIGAVRSNGIGIDGIADNVRIMAVRAVPGGDEHDKDVALAIRYAVDNGAKVINMSFGKPVSPYKAFVDDAVKYAASKGVLLVHGSGNDGKDLSTDEFYPNPMLLDGNKAPNFITVGASGDESTGYIAAPFSNYSSLMVDIFAPGMHIYATASDNRYNAADGTSLASPVVSGVAALLLSYFPHLTPEQVISILMKSGTTVKEDVKLPGEEGKMVRFSELSVSGKIVNAYEAVKTALEMKF